MDFYGLIVENECVAVIPWNESQQEMNSPVPHLHHFTGGWRFAGEDYLIRLLSLGWRDQPIRNYETCASAEIHVGCTMQWSEQPTHWTGSLGGHAVARVCKKPWITNQGVQPDTQWVEVKFPGGSCHHGSANQFYWPRDGSDSEIIEWRPAVSPVEFR